ncbi:2-amino-4-hydroxy-6-hydroxymethyldihydropteridine diphosphokinase [Oceanithermus sp.]|uniref:2-amino-4-hydroxy-6- hydroxymethyldihydropteridine diphosphokinase n=1 Tax=Oceanithermus sp. TaxID=2268145 RepID=UPI0025D5B47F|nr:2-amino-4-hydroxy-6-hydroxymethyldihydropteridine diphosphokinase [Oceanithermus sp.]
MKGTRVLIALGSNLGDRAGFLLAGLARLGALEGFAPGRLSPVYETEPVGPAEQGPYLNAVLEGESALEPRTLLAALLAIERELGRVRDRRWGPRTLDLDLLDYGGRVLRQPGLELPHPRLHERAFVLVPLADLQPGWRHPVLGRTARELLADLSKDGVRPWRPRY